ncbi:MAG: Fic family protein [Mariprofundales bacterium]
MRPVLWQGLLRRLSFGTIEIESAMPLDLFEQVIDAEKFPRNISKGAFHEAFNTFAAMQWLWQRIVVYGEPLKITDEVIKNLHESLMRGVRDDAGFYATKIRVMGKLERVSTTLPEDIPEEVNRWVFRCAAAATLEKIAEAHAWFIAIHPFGDGNGRVGRALLTAQCLNAGLMPPLLNRANQAVYYAAMEHAMVHGRHAPLVRLLHQAATSALCDTEAQQGFG